MPKSTPERRIDRKFTAPVTAAASAATTGSLAVHALVSDYHTATGLTAGHVFQATDTDSFAFAALDHADLTNVTANQHHNMVTVAGGLVLSDQQLTVGVGDGLYLDGTTVNVGAGAGLRIDGTDVYVADGDGISVAGDLVSVEASDLADGVYGIEVVLNDFRLKVASNSGLTLSSGALTLGTPSTATVASTNSVSTTTHTHAVTSSSNPGAAASLLATDSAGTLALDTDTLYVHAGFDNVWINSGTPDGSAALRVTSADTADISLHVRQVSGQTARILRIDDTSGQELIVLDSEGNLQSGNPGFVSGLTGWQITPIGNAEFNNGVFRGELHASIFVIDEFHASGGTLVVAPGGKLENDFTVNYSTGSPLVLDLRTTSGSGSGSQLDIRSTGSGSGTQLTTRTIANHIDISDPESGHAQLFSMTDTLRIKAIGSMSPGLDIWDVWMKVSRVEDLTDYWRYHVEIVSGGEHGLIIPAGTAVISYGVEGDGRILLTADQSYAPYQDIFTIGAEPWNGDITPHVRLGRLDGVGLPGVSGIEQYGLVAGEDLSNADSAYFIMSNLQQAMYRIDSTWHDTANPTVSISADGRVLIGIDVGNTATTAFDFNPTDGTLTIGNASYPAAVTLYGAMTITSGSGYGSLSDIPTSLSDINGTEGTKLTGIEAGATLGAAWGTNLTGRPTELTDGRVSAGLNSSGHVITKVLPGSTVGTPAGAGLFLGSDKMGYYSGSRWLTYIDNSGNFTFSSATSAKIAWDGTDLFGTDGSTVQWYARASTGKIYAGAGAVVLDSAGISVIGDDVLRLMQDASTLKGILYSSNPLDSLLVNTTGVGLRTVGSATAESVSLRANASGGRASEVAIEATGSTSTNRIRMLVYSGNMSTSSQVLLSETTFAVSVGNTGVVDFSIDASGNVVATGTITGSDIINIRSTA